METSRPEVQLISNLVVRDSEGRVLFVKHDPADERWWLPGEDLEVYQHPDDCAKQVLVSVGGLTWQDPVLSFVESFRGRRGWHVMFNYSVTAEGTPEKGQWFAPDALPRTMHGKWELDVIRRVCG